MAENIIDLDSSSFDSTVSASDVPVLVDFWAPWCGPCKAIAPVLEELAGEIGGKAKICKLNVDDNSEIAGKYNIRAIPAMLIFKGGEKVDEIVGIADKAAISSKLEAQM